MKTVIGTEKSMVIVILSIALFVLLPCMGHAAIPQKINYQGYLTTATGVPVNETVQMVFSIYDDATVGNLLWSETQNVVVTHGVYNVNLGDVTPINLTFDVQYYLGIKVGTDPNEMTPRRILTSVGYAFRAQTVESVGSHTHDASQITSGTFSEARVDAAIARDAEVTAAIGTHTAIPSAHHTRYTDAEAVLAIKAADGTGSGLDADLLDGLHASSFASSTHNHDSAYVNEGQGNSITSSMIGDLQVGTSDLANGSVTKGKLSASGAGTSGQVLGTDGTSLVWQSAATAGGWVDDGMVVRLATGTDQVGIGTSTPGALNKLEVSAPAGVAIYGSSGAGAGVMGMHTTNNNRGGIGLGTAGVHGIAGDDQSHAGRFDGPVGVYARTNPNRGIGFQAEGSLVDLFSVGSALAINYSLEQPQNTYLNVKGGNVGIGTETPQQKLHVVGISRFDVASGSINISTPQSTPGIIGYANNGNRADIRFYNGGMILGASSSSSAPPETVAITPGNVSFKGNVQILSASTGATLIELGEGLDYAEGFHVSDKDKVIPGSVLIIDSDNPGKLKLSESPYDTRVAGIVAGGKGLGSAVRLGVGQYDYDVALAGRVYCNVDSSYGEVKPGDLLTTSSTPGYAMVVKDPTKAQGAILGKAMEKLTQGEKGQILVLVTLQ